MSTTHEHETPAEAAWRAMATAILPQIPDPRVPDRYTTGPCAPASPLPLPQDDTIAAVVPGCEIRVAGGDHRVITRRTEPDGVTWLGLSEVDASTPYSKPPIGQLWWYEVGPGEKFEIAQPF